MSPHEQESGSSTSIAVGNVPLAAVTASESDSDEVVKSSDEEEDATDPPYLPDWGVEDSMSAATDGLIVKVSDSLKEIQKESRCKNAYDSDTEVMSVRRRVGRKHSQGSGKGGFGDLPSLFK